jgi:Ran GTPase-activating protein (RanGAP) involved in mRNA processing and transport
MDLCKMVVGPDHIGTSMLCLKTNELFTRFLLGNNIIGRYGARCIANFCKKFPDRMDTWYLASNCINSASFRRLVNQWVRSTSVINIWMKRNPLGASAAKDIFRLITQTTNLRTMDLDQTKLGDACVTELFNKLAQHEEAVALRHIYLNAVGIGSEGAAAISEYLASPHCNLESLYVSNNPLGDDGVEALARGCFGNESLSRLALASVRMSDNSIGVLCHAVRKHRKLKMLNISLSYATGELGSR